MTRDRVGLLLVLALACVPGRARGHVLDSASLSLAETASGKFTVRWNASSPTLQASLATAVVFPAACRLVDSTLRCEPPGLVGELAFPWLRGTTTRVMVDIAWQDGTRFSRVATPGNPTLRVYGLRGSGLAALRPVVADYTKLGVEHILTGFDHLLFVVALTMLVRRRAALLLTITAFTLAHSVSLAATVLGLVHVSSAPVEASIALSIVLVCAECLRRRDSLARRAPWAVAFAFGLLHGLGFASALLDIGVPEQHVPAALASFNVGVELGQLGIIAAVAVARGLASRVPLGRLSRGRLGHDGARRALVYAMGSVAAFWSLDRIVDVFRG